jgi:protein-disulfide isomerase
MSHLTLRPFSGVVCCVLLSPATLCAATGDLPAPETTVAVIGTEQITLAQLPPSTQTDLEESERRYQNRLRQLAIEHRREQHAILDAHVNNYVDRKLLQTEAQAHHETVEQLIEGVKNPEVSDADIRAFYEQHRQQFNQPFEAEMVPITRYLTEQAIEQHKRAYLAGLRTRYAAHVTLEPLREEVAADGPSRGPAQARVTVIEFADFQCPYCRRMEPVLRQMLAKYPRDVRLVYRQMPLTDLHPDALHAAEASLCAAAQGKFWEMHDALFTDPPALDVAGLKATAARVGLESGQFDLCLASGTTEARVKQDVDDALAHGVDGTPGLFINGRFFSGTMPFERLSALIDDELQRQPISVAAAPADPPSSPR